MSKRYIPEGRAYPAPMEFFTKDKIHPDNQKIEEEEQRRWRLLTWHERLRLRRYVASLRRELERGGYNPLALEYTRLRREARRLKAARKTMDPEERMNARDVMEGLREKAESVWKRLQALQAVYANYDHYAGWLEYEATHRRELKREEIRQRKIRHEMRKEAKWLERIILTVFQQTLGCHYTFKNERGKERTKIPRFERCVIRPDAHYFYLRATRPIPFGLGYRWALPRGVTVDRLADEEVLHNLRAATHRQVDVVWSETGQMMYRVARLDSPDALPKLVHWRDIMEQYPRERREKLPYSIGVDEQEYIKWYDFDSDYNVLVAGKAGSGKSNQVNNIVATLASTHSPEELRLVLIDMKGGIEFTHWHELPHVLGDIVKALDQVKPTLMRLVELMRTRQTLLEKARAKKLTAFNRKMDPQDRLPHLIILIDEMNTFVGLGGLTEEIHNLINLLVSQGRATGIYVITATQHPEVAVIPGRIKTNMGVRICFQMPSVTASMVATDTPLAAELPALPGRCIAVRGMDTLKIQSPLVTDADIAGVVSSCKLKYPDVANVLKEVAQLPEIKTWDQEAVLRFTIELNNGRLSADDMHRTLGSESPGERHLRRMVRGIRDKVEAVGAITLDGVPYKIKRNGPAFDLIPLDAARDVTAITDDTLIGDDPVPASEASSDGETEASHEGGALALVEAAPIPSVKPRRGRKKAS